MAIFDSAMKRGGQVLRRFGRDFRGRINKLGDRGSHGLGVDDMQNFPGMGTSHLIRLQGLAESKRRKVLNSECVAMHTI